MDASVFDADGDCPPLKLSELVALLDEDLRAPVLGFLAVVKLLVKFALVVLTLAACVALYCFGLTWLCLFWFQVRLFTYTAGFLQSCMAGPTSVSADKQQAITPAPPLTKNVHVDDDLAPDTSAVSAPGVKTPVYDDDFLKQEIMQQDSELEAEILQQAAAASSTCIEWDTEKPMTPSEEPLAAEGLKVDTPAQEENSGPQKPESDAVPTPKALLIPDAKFTQRKKPESTPQVSYAPQQKTSFVNSIKANSAASTTQASVDKGVLNVKQAKSDWNDADNTIVSIKPLNDENVETAAKHLQSLWDKENTPPHKRSKSYTVINKALLSETSSSAAGATKAKAEPLKERSVKPAPQGSSLRAAPQKATLKNQQNGTPTSTANSDPSTVPAAPLFPGLGSIIAPQLRKSGGAQVKRAAAEQSAQGSKTAARNQLPTSNYFSALAEDEVAEAPSTQVNGSTPSPDSLQEPHNVSAAGLEQNESQPLPQSPSQGFVYSVDKLKGYNTSAPGTAGRSASVVGRIEAAADLVAKLNNTSTSNSNGKRPQLQSPRKPLASAAAIASNSREVLEAPHQHPKESGAVDSSDEPKPEPAETPLPAVVRSVIEAAIDSPEEVHTAPVAVSSNKIAQPALNIERRSTSYDKTPTLPLTPRALPFVAPIPTTPEQNEVLKVKANGNEAATASNEHDPSQITPYDWPSHFDSLQTGPYHDDSFYSLPFTQQPIVNLPLPLTEEPILNVHGHFQQPFGNLPGPLQQPVVNCPAPSQIAKNAGPYGAMSPPFNPAGPVFYNGGRYPVSSHEYHCAGVPEYKAPRATHRRKPSFAIPIVQPQEHSRPFDLKSEATFPSLGAPPGLGAPVSGAQAKLDAVLLSNVQSTPEISYNNAVLEGANAAAAKAESLAYEAAFPELPAKQADDQSKKLAREVLVDAWCDRELARERVVKSFSTERFTDLMQKSTVYLEKRSDLMAMMNGGKLNNNDAGMFPEFAIKDLSEPTQKKKPVSDKELKTRKRNSKAALADAAALAAPDAPPDFNSQLQAAADGMAAAERLRIDAKKMETEPRGRQALHTWQKKVSDKHIRADKLYCKKRKELVAVFGPDGIWDDYAKKYPEIPSKG